MFDNEELMILNALENDQLQRSVDVDEEIAFAKKATKDYLSKAKNVTIRLSVADVNEIKNRSFETGIPYQTIVSSLIHQYAIGKIRLEV